MQSTNHTILNPVSEETDANIDTTSALTERSASLQDYIQDHKLTSSAANDPHQLALADFLFEHMQQRANATQEPTQENETELDATA